MRDFTRPPGEMFKYDSVFLVVKHKRSCVGCWFNNGSLCLRNKFITGGCGSDTRDDGIAVIFIIVPDSQILL
jgi:hypothetical protein